MKLVWLVLAFILFVSFIFLAIIVFIKKVVIITENVEEKIAARDAQTPLDISNARQIAAEKTFGIGWRSGRYVDAINSGWISGSDDGGALPALLSYNSSSMEEREEARKTATENKLKRSKEIFEALAHAQRRLDEDLV
ncbi:hypothetical protein CCP2SC5_200005 [Azospirillaceae bacterium]